MMLDENNYPMTYKQFEERVVELFLAKYESDELEHMKEVIGGVLSESPNYIESFYGETCFVYDNPQLYGENCKKAFEDYHLESRALHNLRRLLESLEINELSMNKDNKKGRKE